MSNLEINTEEKFECIRITREMIFEELKGRYTVLKQDVPGIILNESNIDSLFDLSDKERSKCIKMLETKEEKQTLALVQGYLCLLGNKDFVQCKPPKLYPVAAEII